MTNSMNSHRDIGKKPCAHSFHLYSHVAKLGEITGKTRVLHSKLGEITGKTRVLPGEQ